VSTLFFAFFIGAAVVVCLMTNIAKSSEIAVLIELPAVFCILG